DFKWTYDHGLDPGARGVESYAVPDARTLIVRLREPRAVGLEIIGTHPPLPRHIWDARDWTDPTRNPEINAPTVGAGPFRLAEWVRDNHATFVPNDHYFKGRPRVERYTVRVAGRPSI